MSELDFFDYGLLLTLAQDAARDKRAALLRTSSELAKNHLTGEIAKLERLVAKLEVLLRAGQP